MKKLFVSAALLGLTLAATLADAKSDLQSAISKLKDQPNYSWVMTMEMPGSPFKPGPTEGKTQKEGLTWIRSEMNDNKTEAVLKGEKGVVKTEEGWKTESDLGEPGQGNRGAFMARRLLRAKTPAVEAEEVLKNLKDVKEANGEYSGELTADGVKELMRFGRRGGSGPDVTNPKGNAKFSVKDGMLSKVVVYVEGTINFNGEDRDIKRTTTVEIKDVGSTKVEAPEEAKKKIS